MRRCLILPTVWLMVLTTTVVTTAQEPHVRERARQYEPLMAASAARHGVDPRLLWTITYLESRFRPAAISYKDGKPCASGMMQFVPATAARYDLVNPHDPAQAIESAARYVRDLAVRFHHRPDLILAAYNSGEGTVEAYREGRQLVLANGKIINAARLKTDGVPPYRETQGYVASGLAIYRQISTTNMAGATQGRHAPATAQPTTPPGHLAPEESKRSLYINSSEASTNSAVHPMDRPTHPRPSVLPDSPTVLRGERTRSIYIP